MSSQSETRGQGRAVLLLIAGIPLTMMLAASWLWYFVVEGDLNLVGAIGTANNGPWLRPLVKYSRWYLPTTRVARFVGAILSRAGH